jgi:hypothetical protein
VSGVVAAGEDRHMIVRLEADGAVVADADDCSTVHVETGLDADDLKTALVTTGTGTLADHGTAVLDVGVLRSRARLVATAEDWPRCFADMLAAAGERLTDDGLGLRVPVERPGP